MKLDILAIGAHPDDVELGCGGTLAKHLDLGHTVGILDLTRGELGTRGSAELRDEEAAAAAKVLGVHCRENLGMRDGFFQNDEAHQRAIIEMIRKYQPDVVLGNAPTDRHPDHGRAARLIYDACFLSGLPKIETKLNGTFQEAWRPKAYYNYVQFLHIEPDFVVDISDYFQKKMEAVMAYKSQFYDPDSKEPETFISTPDFFSFLEATYISFGRPLGVRYAEGYIKNRYVGVEDITQLL